MDDLYKSDAWKNATANQRREFISKVQADKRMEKERLVEEDRKKKRAEKMFPSLALEIKNLQILCHECNHGKGNWNQTDWRK
jgi:5-methylcytosine-specific restriction endonuclease McrA